MKTTLLVMGFIFVAVSCGETAATISAMRGGDFRNETRWRLRSIESLAMAILFMLWGLR